MIEVRSFNISSLSLYIESNSSFVRYLALLSSRNQYRDSLHSFRAMYILALKSSLLIPYSASAIFAPILVPLLSNCLDRTYSRFCSLVTRYWHRFMMRRAKSSFFFLNYTTHSSLLIPHSFRRGTGKGYKQVRAWPRRPCLHDNTKNLCYFCGITNAEKNCHSTIYWVNPIDLAYTRIHKRCACLFGSKSTVLPVFHIGYNKSRSQYLYCNLRF